MIERIKKRVSIIGVPRTTALVLIGLSILLTLGFIFSNSVKSQASSAAQSSSFQAVIEEIIPKDTDFGAFVFGNLRKIAHFTEYGLLGIEAVAFTVVLTRRRALMYKRLGLSLIFALLTAFIDETIQIFSKRGPSVSDMWIDIGGFFTYAALAYGIFEIAILIKNAVLKLRSRRHGKRDEKWSE